MSLPEAKLGIKRDSKWVENSRKTWQLFLEFERANKNLDIEDKILRYLFNRYNLNPKPIRPKNIANWASQLFEQLENENRPIKMVVMRRIKTVVTDWERFLLSKHSFKPKQSKYLSLSKLKKLSLTLWKNNPTHRVRWLYRAASVCFVYCWLSGARMQDILRLRWEDISIIKNKTGSFIKADVRHSKGNRGKRGEQLTVMIINDHTLNLFTRLKHWWHFMNKPRSGLVFCKPNKDKTTGILSVSNTELKPFQIKQAAQRAAKGLGWTELPVSKSGRNSIVPVLLKLGVKSQHANIFMRWAHHSEMLSHYQGTHLEYSTTGTAFKIGRAIMSGQIFELKKDIH